MIVYLDTCVWLSIFFSKDPNHQKGVEILGKIKEGQYVALVTHHVLNEILDVLKTRIAMIAKNSYALQMMIKEKYKEFTTRFLQLPNVRIKNPYADAHKVLRPSFSLLYKYLGELRLLEQCPGCGSSFTFKECDTIYRDDALHVILAWHLNCDAFITFDKDFEQIKDDDSLKPMEIEVL